jgi:hypothetical protein
MPALFFKLRKYHHASLRLFKRVDQITGLLGCDAASYSRNDSSYDQQIKIFAFNAQDTFMI